MLSFIRASFVHKRFLFTSKWELRWKTLLHAKISRLRCFLWCIRANSSLFPNYCINAAEALFSIFPNLLKQWHCRSPDKVKWHLYKCCPCCSVVWCRPVHTGTAAAFFKCFTFNTHLEITQKLDSNQDFLTAGPVQRDSGMESLLKL